MYEYPFGNGQHLNLDWFLAEWKNLLAAWEAEKNGIDGALQAEIDRAEAALADVFAARDAAAQSAANALESKNAAAQSASDASGYLATVRADANTASNAAQNAAQSESNAADSAQTAVASKNAAGQSERNAAQSEANANSSKNAAAQSASDAAQSAADADASKSAAAQSAEDAEDAAASVEDSAQQIATNTTDIANLKESINNNTIVNTKAGNPALITDGLENGKIISAIATLHTNSANATIGKYGKENLVVFSSVADRVGLDISTGNTTASGNSGYATTDFIEVSPEKEYCVFALIDYRYGFQPSICFYDENYTFISGYHPSTNLFTKINITIPENAKYIRHSTVRDFFINNSVYIGNPQNCEVERINFGFTANANSIIDYYAGTITDPTTGSISDIPKATLPLSEGKQAFGNNKGYSLEITYQANTKLYIDSKISEIQATMLENIGG